METSQSVCVVMIMVMIYNENGLTVLHIRLSVFLCFVFGFLRIISESTGEWGFSGLTMEVPELRHWQSSDLYFVNSGYVFCVFLLKVILIFINTVCALSLSDVSIIESLFLTLSRWQSFPSKLEHFLIQNTFRQPPLLWLLVTSAMNR